MPARSRRAPRSRARRRVPAAIPRMKNRVQLIAYVDRLGGTFAGLRELLAGPLSGLFGGVHLLPFFHRIDGADAGFDPIDHTRVDARLGTWDDVAALARDIGLDGRRDREPHLEPLAAVPGSARARRSQPVRGVVSDARRRISERRYRARLACDLSAAAGPAVHVADARGWHAPNILDHVHSRADRHRRHASARHRIPRGHPTHVRHARHQDDPARRNRLRDQEGPARAAS